MEILAHLIGLVARLWWADTEIRESSLVGESELDRKSRKLVAWTCGGTLALLIGAPLIGGLVWWWMNR